jgi:hypothetical protein
VKKKEKELVRDKSIEKVGVDFSLKGQKMNVKKKR